MALARGQERSFLGSGCRCIGCANQAPDAAEPDQPNKAARVAPATPVGLPPQQAAASSRGRFPVPEAMQLRFGSKIRQAPEPLPVRPTHDGQAERPLPPGAYVMAPRRYSWEPRQRVAAPPPHAQSPISVPPARPPISAPAQRFPLPEAFALNLSDKAAEDAMQSGHDPSLAQPPQRYPVMDAHVLKPSGQPKEGAPHGDFLSCPEASCLALADCFDEDEMAFYHLLDQLSAIHTTSLLWVGILHCQPLAFALFGA